MYVVLCQGNLTDTNIIGVYSNRTLACEAAAKEATHKRNPYSVYIVVYHHVNHLNTSQIMDSGQWRDESNSFEWQMCSLEKHPSKDVPTQFAYDLFNKDPMALDALSDILKT